MPLSPSLEPDETATPPPRAGPASGRNITPASRAPVFSPAAIEIDPTALLAPVGSWRDPEDRPPADPEEKTTLPHPSSPSAVFNANVPVYAADATAPPLTICTPPTVCSRPMAVPAEIETPAPV